MSKAKVLSPVGSAALATPHIMKTAATKINRNQITLFCLKLIYFTPFFFYYLISKRNKVKDKHLNSYKLKYFLNKEKHVKIDIPLLT